MARLPELDFEAEAGRICDQLRESTLRKLRRRGLVVAISGGIDSSVCAALAVRAVGKERVFGLLRQVNTNHTFVHPCLSRSPRLLQVNPDTPCTQHRVGVLQPVSML